MSYNARMDKERFDVWKTYPSLKPTLHTALMTAVVQGGFINNTGDGRLDEPFWATGSWALLGGASGRCFYEAIRTIGNLDYNPNTSKAFSVSGALIGAFWDQLYIMLRDRA